MGFVLQFELWHQVRVVHGVKLEKCMGLNRVTRYDVLGKVRDEKKDVFGWCVCARVCTCL